MPVTIKKLLAALTLIFTPVAATATANPAALFCQEQNGTYATIEDAAGQRGICTLPDGTDVDAWEFFRANHSQAGTAADTPAVADKIWFGGTILTLLDDAMRAEAIAEKAGEIIAVGSADAVMRYRGADTQMVDLAGRTMLPGFVDAHGHVFLIGVQALSANLLPAPDGDVNSIPDLQRIMREYADTFSDRVERVGLIMGFGYDDSQLVEQRHPTRDDLDAITSDIPIFVMHQSGHLGAANSKALEMAGITADTPNPPGGVIRRRDGSTEPNGVFEENGMAAVIGALMGDLDEDAGRAIFRAGLDLITTYGYTTAQEGRASPGVAQLMQAVATEEGIGIDVVTYPDILIDRDFIARTASRDYTDRMRVGGAKLTIDGSPQGFTALRDKPYYNPPEGFREDYKGYAAASTDQVFDAIDWAFANNIQILTHSNGEGASDILIGALRAATQTHGAADRRPVLIHGQFLRKDQVAAYDALDVFPSLFPMHTFYWGDWHRERTVGPEAADNISPTGWFRERGMMFSSHHDAPVAFPDSMRILDATVTRRSRSGDIIGPDHRVDVITALKAMTIWPAYQHFEEDSKGTLEVGKRADFAILSADPTAVDPETLDTIEVVETIKEGETIYARDLREGRLQYRPLMDGKDPYANFLRGLTAAYEMPRPSFSGRPLSALSPSAPHSSACIAATLGTLLMAGLETPTD